MGLMDRMVGRPSAGPVPDPDLGSDVGAGVIVEPRPVRPATVGTVSIGDPAMADTATYCGVDAHTVGVLAAWADDADAVVGAISQAFYDHLLASDVNGILDEHSSVARQRPLLEGYVRSLFTGVVDDDHVAGRVRNGQVHDRVGLSASRYYGQYRFVVDGIAGAVRAAGAGPAETAEVMGALQRMITFDMALATEAITEAREADLVGVVDNVRGTAEQLTAQSSDLAASAEQTLASTEVMNDQAHDLANVSERLANATQAMADQAAEGADTVRQAADGSESTAEVLDVVTTEVHGLAELATQIEQIIRMISDIASRTNLLALNAAIEAARAGEAGRGFAVVADEVKGLSESTEHAVGDVTELIRSTSAAVGRVVEAVQRTEVTVSETTGHTRSAAAAFAGITEQVMSANDEVAQMAVASKELGSVTMELRGAAGSVAEAAESLSGLAHGLGESISA